MGYTRNFRGVIVSAPFVMSLILVSTVLAGREGPAAKSLSFFPKGVALGTSADDLQKCRPGAKEFRIARDGEKEGTSEPRGDLTKGNHLLIEELGADSELTAATYRVRNGVLVCIGVSKNWSLPQDWYLKGDEAVNAEQADARALRQKIFAECRERFGGQYRLEAVRIHFSDTVRYLAPRFCWISDGVTVALTCTSEYQDVEMLQGFVGIVSWLAKEDIKPPFDPAQEVDKEVLSRLAQPLVKK